MTDTYLTDKQIADANNFIVQHLQNTMNDGRGTLSGLGQKLSITYWVVIVLSVIMFFVGIVLISVPAIAAFRGQITELQSLVAAGFGLADLAGLFLLRPIERIHGMMGDMSQIVVALNNFQAQVGLRLMQLDAKDRPTVGTAAEMIDKAAKDSVEQIQKYFEGEPAAK
jgi:hypothetical protein